MHVKYVYEKFLSSGSQPITIIAHSAGGMAVVALLLSEFSEELENRVRGIAFTDSVHDMHAECPDWIEDKEAFSRAHNIITTRAINWIGSDNPLDTPLNPRQQTRCVSAGHEKHVYTSPSAFPSVFPFLDGMLKGEGLPAWSELRIEADENESKEEAENGDANKRALEPAVDQSNPQSRVVFLDVDGVLHPFISDEEFLPNCMKSLKKIIDATGAVIVLSSSWQNQPESFEAVNMKLVEHAISKCYDQTCGGKWCGSMPKHRAKEVVDYSRKFPDECANGWVALDDLNLIERKTFPDVAEIS